MLRVSILCNMHSRTFTALPKRARGYSLHKAREFHLEAFTGLLEKLFLDVFFKQEMTVGEAAMKLGFLILKGKKRNPRVVWPRILKT